MADEIIELVCHIEEFQFYCVGEGKIGNNFERQEFGIIRCVYHGGHPGKEWGAIVRG